MLYYEFETTKYSITILTSTVAPNTFPATTVWNHKSDALPNHNAEPAANAIALPPVSTACLLLVDVNELIVISSPAVFSAVEATIETSAEAFPKPTDNTPEAPASTFSVKKIPMDDTKDPAGIKDDS